MEILGSWFSGLALHQSLPAKHQLLSIPTLNQCMSRMNLGCYIDENKETMKNFASYLQVSALWKLCVNRLKEFETSGR